MTPDQRAAALRLADDIAAFPAQFNPVLDHILDAALAGLRALADEPVAEPMAWECKAGGLRRLTQSQYEAQSDSIKRHYTRIEPPKREPRTPMEEFEDAICKVGIVAACEWFGHASDSEFTKETVRIFAAHGITGGSDER